MRLTQRAFKPAFDCQTHTSPTRVLSQELSVESTWIRNATLAVPSGTAETISEATPETHSASAGPTRPSGRTSVAVTVPVLLTTSVTHAEPGLRKPYDRAWLSRVG